MFKKLFENVNEYKVSKFEACYEEDFCYSIQLSTYLFKREPCKFVYTPSHYRVYVSARTYYLKSRLIFRQILLNIVCKAFSHAFKVKAFKDKA